MEFTGPDDGAVVEGVDPGPPLFDIGTGGTLSINAPLAVTSIAAPDEGSLSLGATNFSGPVAI